MKHKGLYIVLAIASAVLSSSCNKWLEATASGQVSDTQMFSSRSGFLEALSGIYIDMGSDECYGKYYTWSVNDLVAYPYSPNPSIEITVWQSHKYNLQAAVPVIRDMWRGGYNIIANVNRVLKELENTTVLSYSDEKQVVKGELLAIRAYVHFDLVRMFGPVGYGDEDKKKLTIPYATAYEKAPAPQHSLEETMALVLADIDAALQCLEKDPVTDNGAEQFLATCNTDGYWNGRTRHLNYYAVLALKARVFAWMDRIPEAAEIAKQVMDETLEKGIVSWIDPDSIVKAVSNDDRDWTFSSEHLFSLDITGLYSKVQPYHFSLSNSGTFITVDYLTIDAVFNQGIVSNQEDIRGPALMMSYNTSGYTLNKFFGSSTQKAPFRDRMPMLRLSEMLLLRAEDAIGQNQADEAKELLALLREKRGITSPAGVSADETFLDEEYVREFVGEGQLFFYEKRVIGRNKAAVRTYSTPFYTSPAENAMVYPYPQEELNYGRVQEF